MNQIFIGGTGRSGTTILSQWLGSHSSVARFPCEARFHVDSGGVLSLFNALTRDYSNDQARIAYRNFIQMMRSDLTDRYTSPYQGIDLRGIFGLDYDAALSDLESSIVLGRFNGRDYHTDRSLPRFMHRVTVRAGNLVSRLTRGRIKSVTRIIRPVEEIYAARRLDQDEAELIFRRFVERLFNSWAESQALSGWCEDTPANALHIKFLMRVLPASRHLCVVRNPYGTALSFSRQIWAPSEFDLCVDVIENLYSKIILEIKALDSNERERLKIVRLEDLHSEDVRREVREFAGLRDEPDDGSIQWRRVNIEDEGTKLTSEQVAYVNHKLGFVNDVFDYATFDGN